MSEYLIHSESEGGYWSNEYGWVGDHPSATHFTQAERDTFDLPDIEDARWVEHEDEDHERDPYEVYGTLEHEAWLMEMERTDNYQ